MIGIRNNSLRQTIDELITLLPWQVTRVSFYDDALLVEATKEEVTSHAAYTDGKLYIQNLSSQLPALVLDPKRGERILDICAAPGSKTTQLAALMGNSGEIVANDASRVRSFKLKALLEKYGVTNTRVVSQKGEFLWRKYTDEFDRVLVDAPCSMDLPKTDKEIKALARQQTYLLRSAISCVKPGGVVVYSTCTSDERENEAVVDWVCEHVAEVEVVPIKGLLPEFETKEGYIRIVNNDSFEPFFVAKFVTSL